MRIVKILTNLLPKLNHVFKKQIYDNQIEVNIKSKVAQNQKNLIYHINEPN